MSAKGSATSGVSGSKSVSCTAEFMSVIRTKLFLWSKNTVVQSEERCDYQTA